jgi:hypothetical protein
MFNEILNNNNNIRLSIDLLKKINYEFIIQIKYIDDIKNKQNNYEKIDIINFKPKEDSNTKQYTNLEITDFGFLQLLNKIFNKYNNKKNKKIINDYFQEHFYSKIKILVRYIDDLIKTYEDIYNKNINNGNLLIYNIELKNLKFKNFYYGITPFSLKNGTLFDLYNKKYLLL